MMTLKDLKKRVPVADEKKVILRKKELLNTGAEIVVKEIIEDGVEISVYDNGYVLYEEGRHRTVFRLPRKIFLRRQLMNMHIILKSCSRSPCFRLFCSRPL